VTYFPHNLISFNNNSSNMLNIFMILLLLLLKEMRLNMLNIFMIFELTVFCLCVESHLEDLQVQWLNVF